MELTYTVKNLVLLVGAAQGFFLAMALFIIKKGNRRANFFLSLYILSFSLLSLSDLLTDTRLLLRYPQFLLVFDPLLFSLAPFCYFYVKLLTDPGLKFRSEHVAHFIPMFALYAMASPIYMFGAEDKIQLIMDEYKNPEQSIDILLLVAVVQIAIYLFISLRLLTQHSREINNAFSNRASINLTWLKIFLIINFSLWAIFAFSTIVRAKSLVNLSDVLFSFTVYLIGYFGLRQPAIFFYDQHEASEIALENDPSPKYAGSSLTEAMAQHHANELLRLMRDKKLYLKNDLKLIDLADKLKMPLHHLSQVINDTLQKNFYDFVNEYRVTEFKSQLVNPQYAHLTILAIGLNSGFNSKAAMNAIFKKHTGLSPSQYRNRIVSSQKSS